MNENQRMIQLLQKILVKLESIGWVLVLILIGVVVLIVYS